MSTMDSSPLKYHFLRRMHSETSAISIKQKNGSFACQMVIIDLLAAAVKCWIVFLAQTLPRIRRYSPRFDQRSRLQNASALGNISVIVRELDLAVGFTIQAAARSVGAQDATAKSPMEAVELELTTKTQSLKNKV